MKRALAFLIVLAAPAAHADFMKDRVDQYTRCLSQSRVYFAARTFDGSDDAPARLAAVIKADPNFAQDVKEGRVDRDVREAISWANRVSENRERDIVDLTNEYIRTCLGS